MKVQLVNRKNWRVIKVWRKDDLEPGSHKVTWSGNNRHGKAAKKGAYLFRIRTKQGADVDRSRTKGDDRSVNFFPDKFPLRGKHQLRRRLRSAPRGPCAPGPGHPRRLR